MTEYQILVLVVMIMQLVLEALRCSKDWYKAYPMGCAHPWDTAMRPDQPDNGGIWSFTSQQRGGGHVTAWPPFRM